MALVFALAPFFVFPSRGRAWIFLCVPLLLIVKWAVLKKPFERTAMDWPLAIFAVQIFISAVRTTDWGLSLPKIAGMTYALLVFYAVVEALKSEKAIRWGVAAFFGGGFLFAIFGLFGMRVDEAFYQKSKLDVFFAVHEKIPKIHFNLPGAEEGFNSNAVGGGLTLFIPAMFVLILFFLKTKKLPGHGILIVTLSAAFLIKMGVLALAASRSSWVGTVLSMAVAGWILFLIPKKRYGLLIPLVAGTMVVLIIGYVTVVQSHNWDAAARELEQKYQGRHQAWAVGVEMITASPLTGVGLNHVRLDPRIGYDRAHTHNHMLHTAAELGIPALAAYLALLLGAAWMCRDVYCGSGNEFFRMAVVGLGAGQLAHFIFGLADSVSFGTKPGLFFWISLGLIAAVHNMTGDKEICAG
jgi:putative inorganic carbon (hco3(-)) transporter